MRVAFLIGAAPAALCILGLAACSDGGVQAGAGQVQAASAQAKIVNISGCARPVAASSCVAVRGPGGVMYDVSSANPGPDPAKGVSVQITGSDQGRTSACGKVLTDVKWDYLTLRCSTSAPTEEAPSTQIAAAQ